MNGDVAFEANVVFLLIAMDKAVRKLAQTKSEILKGF
ncbi:hypothetical protein B6N60_00928 [Richelia sinica FACHB-800]|uniref:Uncharacterized protein n=1 Tax=Richelia sinica FACHB-800 TaxID=1357546 RepID=A0A975Y3K9_9NOST|nr:hypothetical protein B6N60_00928 [Richelia sinica FACHB-800]